MMCCLVSGLNRTGCKTHQFLTPGIARFRISATKFAFLGWNRCS